MKVYIAAPFFTKQQLEIVERIESELKFLGIDYFSPRTAGVLKDMSEKEQKQSKKEIFDGNISNMDDCTHMIACVEYKDTGTTFEIGYYHAQRKPIVLFSENIGTINVMLAECAYCVCDNANRINESLFGLYNAEINSLT